MKLESEKVNFPLAAKFHEYLLVGSEVISWAGCTNVHKDVP
jgi:hypothetical protein